LLKDKVRSIRKEMGLTQEEFAKKLGITRGYLSDIERGRLKGNNVSLISKLSDISGKPMEYFVDKDVDIQPFEVLNSAMDMLIDKGYIDDDGSINDEMAKNIIMEILKKELCLKIKSRE